MVFSGVIARAGGASASEERAGGVGFTGRGRFAELLGFGKEGEGEC